MKSPSAVNQFSQQLMRVRRRAARQKRNISSSAQAWQRWSVTMEDAMTIVGQLAAVPASDVDDLARKFDAILWAIEVNDSLKDETDLRRLRSFGRQLRVIAGSMES